VCRVGFIDMTCNQVVPLSGSRDPQPTTTANRS